MTPIRTLAGGAALAFLIAGCAAAAPYNPGGLSGDQLARVDRACIDIVGTEPGEAHHDACVTSLSGSVQWARLGPSAAVYEQGGAPAGTRRSYFHGSPQDIHRREQRACASVGFDPANRSYESCVADLAASLIATDHPLN